MEKSFVLDTSVLLHDPEAIFAFAQHEVVIPLVVVEELDHVKKNRDEIGKNARMVLQILDQLADAGKGDLHHGIDMPTGGRVRIQLEIKTDCDPQYALSLRHVHYRIVMAALLLQEHKRVVVLVSKNLAIRVKAQAMGIKAEDYLNRRFSYDSIYRGFREISVTKQEIDLFIKEGFLKLDNASTPNEYYYLYADEQNFRLGYFDPRTQGIVPLHRSVSRIWGISPLNIGQQCAFDLLLRDDIQLVTLLGPAGTGKTLLALAAGLRKVFDESVYSRILVSRPIVPLGRDIGYLPGLKEEKLVHWMQPIYDNLEFLCGFGEGPPGETLRWITESKKLEMEAVTYIRGRSLPKIYMILDEAQNLNSHELKTIISRAGKGTKVVLTGDPTQIDHPYLDKDSNGLTYVVGRFQGQSMFGHIFLDKTERSPLAALAAEIM